MTKRSVLLGLLLVMPIAAIACTLSLLRSPVAPPANASDIVTASPTPPPATVAPPSPQSPSASPPTSAPPTAVPPLAFCDDPAPRALLDSFEKAVRSADGALLASLVSPDHGMDARLLRDGRVVNYDAAHAAALFESTYVVEWGSSPGSGLPVRGSFKELFVPDLLDVFSKSHTVRCNEIQVGGATYTPEWPYADIDFYSVYYPGSAGFGSLDWHTWLFGMHRIDDQPYLYAIVQFKWEI